MKNFKLTRDDAAIMEVKECHVYAETEAQAKQVAKERLPKAYWPAYKRIWGEQ